MRWIWTLFVITLGIITYRNWSSIVRFMLGTKWIRTTLIAIFLRMPGLRQMILNRALPTTEKNTVRV